MSLNTFPKNEIDPAIWISFKSGDWEAYVQLYQTYFKVLNNYGYKFSKDVKLIEDAVHDLFVNLWTKRTHLGDPASVRNYLFKSLRNTLFRKIQAEQRFVKVDHDNDYPFHFEVSFDNHFMKNEAEAELKLKIKKLIKTLPARQQEIIYLRFFEELSYEEISDIMNINSNSTYKLLYKAIDTLQKNFKAEELVLLICILTAKNVDFQIN